MAKAWSACIMSLVVYTHQRSVKASASSTCTSLVSIVGDKELVDRLRARCDTGILFSLSTLLATVSERSIPSYNAISQCQCSSYTQSLQIDNACTAKER